MNREAYEHNRALPCPVPHCQAESVRLVGAMQNGRSLVTLQCRCCGFRVSKEGTDFFRTAADAFANWNNQTMRGAA